MKRFKRCRSLKGFKAQCKRRGWTLDSTQHDHAGTDHVRFDFTIGKISGTALFNTCNGRVFGELSTGVKFNTDSDAHENTKWFGEILDAAYVS